MNDLTLRSAQVLTPDGARPAAVVVRGGRIAAVEPYDAATVGPVVGPRQRRPSLAGPDPGLDRRPSARAPAHRRRHLDVSAPAELVGLAGKGRIEVGCDADLAVLAPHQPWTVDARTLHHRHPITSYDRRQLHGVVRATYLHGRRVELDAEPGGRLLQR